VEFLNVKPGGTYSNLWELGDKPDSHCGNAHGQLTVRKIILYLYAHAFVHTNGHSHVKRGGFKWARVCPEKIFRPKLMRLSKNFRHTKLNCARVPEKSSVWIFCSNIPEWELKLSWTLQRQIESSFDKYHMVQHFNFQLMHTTLKNVELLKHFKISKTAPTCFGLQGNHHQGATVST